MKKIIYLICLLSVAFSCSKKEEKKVVEKRIEKKSNFKEQDKQYCEKGKRRAISDIKKNKLVYYKYYGLYEIFRSEKELKQILSKFNIELRDGFSSCIPMIDEEGENCYANEMKYEIERKFGKSFLDSITKCADKEFVLKNPNVIYSFDECDKISRYPNAKDYSDSFEKPTRDFDLIVEYPKAYDHKKEKLFSTTAIQFILTKSGMPKNITVETNFVNPKNNKFIPFFKKKAVEFVKKTKWIPAKKNGINVSSEMRVILEHT